MFLFFRIFFSWPQPEVCKVMFKLPSTHAVPQPGNSSLGCLLPKMDCPLLRGSECELVQPSQHCTSCVSAEEQCTLHSAHTLSARIWGWKESCCCYGNHLQTGLSPMIRRDSVYDWALSLAKEKGRENQALETNIWATKVWTKRITQLETML